MIKSLRIRQFSFAANISLLLQNTAIKKFRKDGRAEKIINCAAKIYALRNTEELEKMANITKQ